MRSALEVTTQIRQVVRTADGCDQTYLQTIVSEYNSLVELANRRLQRASAWLQEGLIVEAVDHTEVAPDVLDMAATLDLGALFFELKDLAVQRDLGDVLAVDADAAAELNEAYARYEVIQPVLRAYSRAVLESASLSQRLKRLEELRALDPTNEIWRTQRQRMEEARIHEIEKEAVIAARAGDRATLEIIAAEVNRHGWSHTPSKKLVSGITNALSNLRMAEASRRYEELVPEIHLAYGAGDESETDRLLCSWESIQSELGVPSAPEHQQEVNPAVAWRASRVEAESRRQEGEELLVQLEWDLDQKEPSEEDERLLKRIERLGVDVPQHFRARVEQRGAGLALAKRRRRRWIIVGAMGVIVVSASLVGWRANLALKRTRISRFVTAVEACLAEDPVDLAAITKLVEVAEAEHAWILSEPDAVRLVSDYEVLRERDQSRRSAFSEVMARLTPLRFDSPDVWPLLKRTEELASDLSEEDRLAVLQMRSRLSRNLQAYVSTLVEEHGRERAAILARAEAARGASSSDMRGVSGRGVSTEFPPLLNELRNLRDSLQAMSWTSSQEARVQARVLIAPALEPTEAAIAQLHAELADARGMESRARDRQAALNRIRENSGDLEQLRTSLEQFVATYPELHDAEPPYAEHFQAVLSEATAWSYVAKHAEICELMLHMPQVSDAGTALRRLEVLRALKELVTQYPGQEHIERYERYLSTAVYMLGPDVLPARIAGLQDVLRQPMFTQLNCVEAPAKGEDRSEIRRYYTYSNAQPKWEPMGEGFRMYRVKSVIDSQDQLDPAAQRRDVSVLVPKHANLQVAPAPHVRVVERMQGLLGDDAFAAEWDTLFLRLAILIQGSTMDELLRIQLLAELLQLHQDTSWNIDAGIVEFLSTYDRTVLQDNRIYSDLAWVSVTDSDVINGRESAREFIDQWMPDLSTTLKELRERLSFESRDVPRYRCVGIAWADDAGRALLDINGSGPVFSAQLEDEMLVMIEMSTEGPLRATELRPGTPVFSLVESRP